MSLSLAVKRKLDNSDDTNLCNNSKKAEKAKKVLKKEKFSLQNGQMIVSENKENRCLYVSDGRESRQNLQDLDVMKGKDKKKEKSKKQKRKELVDSCDLASQLRRDDIVGHLSGQMMFSADDEELTPKKRKKKKKSKRTVQEGAEECRNIHTSREKEDEILSAKNEEQSPTKKKKKKSKRTVVETWLNCQYLDVMRSKDEKRKDGVESELSDDLGVKNLNEDIDLEKVKVVNDLNIERESSKSSSGKKKRFKLANKEDLNLLSNPEEDGGIIIHPESRRVDNSIVECILSDPCVSSFTYDSHDEIPSPCMSYPEGSAASVSWHTPVSTPKSKSYLKSIAKEAVTEVLSDSVGSLEKGRPHGSKLRRSLVNYELLCKTGPSKDRKVYIDDDYKTVGEYYENNNNESKIKYSPVVENIHNEASDDPMAVENIHDEVVNEPMGVENIHDEASNDPMAVKDVTIKDLYRLPKRKKVPPVIYDTCKFIFSQQVQVSDVNRVYTGHCVPGDMEYRKFLKRKFKAKFGKYYKEQDEMLMKRFNILVQNGIVENKEEFCNFLNTYCSGKDKKELVKNSRNIGVRNIIGLFVGQDMPRKLAAVHCLRLIKLVLGHSYLFRRGKEAKQSDLDTNGSLMVEQAVDDLAIPTNDDRDATPNHNAKKTKKRSAKKWTRDENEFLIEWVISGSGPRADDVDPMKVDWDGASQSLGRDIQNVREHWCRTIQPILAEDVEPAAILMFRKELLEEVVKSGAGNRKDISWASLAKVFRPRSTYAISATFHDLMRGSGISSRDTSEEFRERVNVVLSKVKRNLALPKEKMAKCVKKTKYKKELQVYYWRLLD